MDRVPSKSPTTGNEVPPYYIHASDAFFRDTSGRAILLRGVNLSGADKAPIGQPSQKLSGFWEKAEAGGDTFVGQPLNLEDGSADVHLARLRVWGFNCFRYVFTWEALEHQGPGKYDTEFMDYTVEVLRKIKEYGFRVFMDPHQDLFSRFTGGSGAPYWVLRACGMNPRNMTPTQAAFLHSEWPNAENPSPIDYPDMLWATNYTRLAAATLSILFFAGHQYAPKCIIDDQPISRWLQTHYFAAVAELAKRIRDAGDLLDECVIGWDSMNEPNPTFVGLAALDTLPEKWKLRKGPMPTPLQGMRLGTGQKETVENYVFGSLGPKRKGNVTVDPQGKSIWMTAEEDAEMGGDKWGWKRSSEWPLGRCIWAAHGVWDEATGQVLKGDYFNLTTDDPSEGADLESPRRPVDFVADFWLPHWRGYAAILRPIHPEAIMFLQPPVFEPPPHELTHEDLMSRACISCHFYDGLTLITKHWNWFNADAVGFMRGKYPNILWAVRAGTKAIRQCMRDQLGYLRADTLDVIGQYPTLIGEIGIPFDLDNKRTYFGDAKGHGVGDYSGQTQALDASINACDGSNLLSYTLWTYCADNTHLWGDGWNGEDLSIWSIDDIKRDKAPASVGAGESSEGGGNTSEGVGDKIPGLSGMTRALDKCPDRVPSALEGTRPRTLSKASYSSLRLPSTLAGGSSSSVNLEGNGTASASGSSTPGRSRKNSSLAPLTSGPGNSEPTARVKHDAEESVTATELAPADIAYLSNGARSSSAFCRPFPVASLGTPVDINFDIKSSQFTYSLSVTPDDVAAEKGQEDGGTRIPTEIYVPFIHYATDAVAGAAAGNLFDSGDGVPAKVRAMRKADLRKQSKFANSSSSLAAPTAQTNPDAAKKVKSISPLLVTSSTTLVTPEKESASPYRGGATIGTSLSAMENLTSSEASIQKLMKRHGAGGTKSYASSLSGRSGTNSPTAEAEDELANMATLDLDVEVSSGTWEVEGQYLRWYLPTDAAEVGVDGLGTKTGQAAATHTIKIKRAGGPLDFSRSASAWDLLSSGCGMLY